MSQVETKMHPLTQLTEDEQMLKDAAADFADNIIQPKVHEMDEAAKLDPDLIKQFFEMGLMGIEIPEKYNGAGGSFFMSIVAIEQISRVDASVGVFMDVQNTLVNNAFIRWGSEELKEKYLPQLATEKVGAYCLSEAGSGSDAFALKCAAKEDGDDYVLNGSKLWITNANEADIFLVFANVDPMPDIAELPGLLLSGEWMDFRSLRKRISLEFERVLPVKFYLKMYAFPKKMCLGK